MQVKCSRKYNLGREGHPEMVHLCFVAEIILVVITDGMFPSVFRWSSPHRREWLVWLPWSKMESQAV